MTMTKVDFGTALTCQTLKGYGAGCHRPVAGISIWTSISVMATGISKFDVLVAIRMIGDGGVYAGRLDSGMALEKQAVGYKPGRYLFAFGGSIIVTC